MTDLGTRIETYLHGRGEVSEGRVLSGIGYFLDGRLVAAVMGEDLCVNVGENWRLALNRRGARPFLFADRPVRGWVMVDRSSLVLDDDLAGWIETIVAR